MTSRTSLPAIVALVAALVAAAPAGAKELSKARACDADDCRTVTDRSDLRALDDRAPATAPEQAAPFHRIRMTITHDGTDEFRFTVAYVPSLNHVRDQMPDTGEYLWSTPSPRAERAFDRLTRGLEPVPARRLRGTAADTARDGAAAPAAPAGGGDGSGGPPWFLVLIPAAFALAAAAWAARRHRPRLGATPRST